MTDTLATMARTMMAVGFDAPGGPEVLRPETLAIPVPGPGQVLVKTAFAGVNRPDVIQRKGHYPAPPGASPIPGLEISGEITACGDGVAASVIGQHVCALVTGGGYAQYCLAQADHCLPVPKGLSLAEAAALPETLFTVWHNVLERGWAKEEETLLVHGGTSGIGTMAIQIATLVGARSLVTCGSRRKAEACLALGAEVAVNYREEEWAEAVSSATGGDGVNVVLDVVGAKYLDANLRALTADGRLVVIGLQGGRKAELDLGRLLARRLTVHGTTLRSRSPREKGEIADEVVANVWPAVAEGRVRPVIDRVLPWSEVAEAHRVLERGDNIGKVLLHVGTGEGES